MDRSIRSFVRSIDRGRTEQPGRRLCFLSPHASPCPRATVFVSRHRVSFPVRVPHTVLGCTTEDECNQRINQPTNVVEQGTGAKMNPCSGRVSSRRSDRNESIIQPPRNEIESNQIQSNHPSMPHHTPLNILSCFRRESLAPRHPGTITTRGLFRSFPGFLRFSVRDPWNFL